MPLRASAPAVSEAPPGRRAERPARFPKGPLGAPAPLRWGRWCAGALLAALASAGTGLQ